jgi:putative transposase
VENNPVAAQMVAQAEGWAWSSARSHLRGRPAKGDPLTDLAALAAHVPNWRAMLCHGLAAGGADAAGEAVAEAIEARLRTGRLLGAADWIAAQEAATGRRLIPAKRGPKRRAGSRDGN